MGYRELRWDHPRVVSSPVDHKALKERPYPWIGEHRLVMSYELGKELESDIHVHHIDGNKLNNVPSNLTALDKEEHRREHSAVFRELEAAKREIGRLKGLLQSIEIVANTWRKEF